MSKALIAEADALIKIMEKCGDAWWGGVGDADDTDWRAAREIAYRIRARLQLYESAAFYTKQGVHSVDQTGVKHCLDCNRILHDDYTAEVEPSEPTAAPSDEGGKK